MLGPHVSRLLVHHAHHKLRIDGHVGDVSGNVDAFWSTARWALHLMGQFLLIFPLHVI